MATKKRKLDHENRVSNNDWENKYYFIEINGKPMCLLCNESVSALKEYNIRRHYETHKIKFKDSVELKGDQREDKLRQLKSKLQSQQNSFAKHKKINENAVKASFLVSKLIAEKSKPFVEGEFIKECLMTIVETVCPERKNLFSDISLSARTVTRRIEDMSQNLDNQLSKISQTFTAYSLALDESLDCTDISQLSIFIRGTNETFEIYEELLKVVSIHNKTKGIDIFNELIDLLTINKIDLTKLVSITTDGAPSMIGKYNGIVAHMSNKLKEVCDQKLINYHCIIHQEALCSKSAELSNVMRIVIETVNKIRANPLSHRQFRELLEEIDAEYGDLIFYSHVRWLSRGKVLMRFFKLREEIDLFLITKDKQVKELSDPKFNFDLAFMVDLTAYLNELNLKLQGESQLVVEMFNQIKTFEVKLDL
jgi:hypothetical protein